MESLYSVCGVCVDVVGRRRKGLQRRSDCCCGRRESLIWKPDWYVQGKESEQLEIVN